MRGKPCCNSKILHCDLDITGQVAKHLLCENKGRLLTSYLSTIPTVWEPCMLGCPLINVAIPS
uniref:Uncharacterized protein n=1 Tax=Rhizophora mucronata TaxID=61149 RepID=A0A2P2QRJ2_RHIMU